MLTPLSSLGGRCFHQQFIHVEVHIEIGGWQWSHPFFIANLKILWSLPAFHQQQPPRLCCGCFYTICPGWTLIELFPLLSLFPFLLYPISYPGTFFSIDQGCTTFDELTKKVTLFPCFLLSSVGSLGRTHIIGLLKGEWCIGEYYFGFQRDFKFRPVEIYIIMILDPHHLCHPGHVEHLPV